MKKSVNIYQIKPVKAFSVAVCVCSAVAGLATYMALCGVLEEFLWLCALIVGGFLLWTIAV